MKSIGYGEYCGLDEKSQKIWNLTQDLLKQHDLALDIVNDDAAFVLEKSTKKSIIGIPEITSPNNTKLQPL